MVLNGDDIYIVDAVRTPFLRNRKKWKNLPVENLGALALGHLAKTYSVGVDQTKHPRLDAVIMGCHAAIKENFPGVALPVIPMQNPAKEAWLKTGLDPRVSATTINKVCSSGLAAVIAGYEKIKSGNAKTVLAGGMENLLSFSEEMMLTILSNHTSDPPHIEKTWHAGEWCAEKIGLDRRALDDYALESYKKARYAIIRQWFKDEIVGVGETLEDEEPFYLADSTKLDEKIRQAEFMEGCFSVTGMNSSKNATGAGAIYLAPGSLCEEMKYKPLARIAATEEVALATNREFTVAPVEAIKKCAAKAGLTVLDLDAILINEAFASVSLYAKETLDLPGNIINPWGGAIGLGHPIGGTGAMLLAMLAHGLKREQKQFGLLTLCHALGGATAIVIEIC